MKAKLPIKIIPTAIIVALSSIVITACHVNQNQDTAQSSSTQNTTSSNTPSPNSKTSKVTSHTTASSRSEPPIQGAVATESIANVDAQAEPMAVSGHAISKQKMATAPLFRSLSDVYQQQSTENYHQEQINPVFLTKKDPVSTFSIDVDTASYSNVRRMLNMGQWPAPGSVRVEEMINYFDYNYQGPKTADTPFSVHTEVAPTPWGSNTQLLKIGLQGYQLEQQQLPALNLVFLVDVSGSMKDSNKLPLLKRAFALLTQKLRPQDSVSIVTYASATGVALKPTSGDNKQIILAALDRLTAAGSTNGGAGIKLAYQTAKQQFKKDGVNRVILASDGDFNVGMTSMSSLEQLIKQERQSGINLTILGFGQGNYNDHLTEKLSNIGNGNAYYIDNFSQARKVFSQQLTGTLQTIAKDVKIQVEFNPAYVSEYRLVGYDNRKLNNQDFKNDKVDAGDIGAGHNVTAFYEITLTKDGYHYNEPLRYQPNKNKSDSKSDNKTHSNTEELAYVKLRYKTPNSNTSTLISQPVKVKQIHPRFKQASTQFKFATAVLGFAEQLRQSPYIDWPLRDIAAMANNNLGEDKWGYRREFMQLTRNAEALAPQF